MQTKEYRRSIGERDPHANAKAHQSNFQSCENRIIVGIAKNRVRAAKDSPRTRLDRIGCGAYVGIGKAKFGIDTVRRIGLLAGKVSYVFRFEVRRTGREAAERAALIIGDKPPFEMVGFPPAHRFHPRFPKDIRNSHSGRFHRYAPLG